MADQPTFTIIAQVGRDSLRSAIEVTEQLIEHGYVDEARVAADHKLDSDMLDARMAELEEFDWSGAIEAIADAQQAAVRLWNALSTSGQSNPETGKINVIQSVLRDLESSYRYGRVVYGSAGS